MAVIRLYDLNNQGKNQVNNVISEISEKLKDNLSKEGTIKIVNSFNTYTVNINSEEVDVELVLTITPKNR